jgi:FHA domain
VKTIGIDLWDGQVRAGGNAQTVMRPAVVPQLRRGIRELFLENYPRFAPVCRTVEEPGLAIIAVDDRTARAAGIVKVLARVGRTVAAIAGRHDQCDLYLRGNDGLALRQFAVVLAPVKSWAPGEKAVQYRVMDLRTNDGMADEDGRHLRGIRAEGPSILRCGGYTFFILTLGDPSDFPPSATDAWDVMPERVYFDELETCAGGSAAKLRLPRNDLRQSYIFRTAGPRETGVIDPTHRQSACGVVGNERDLAGRLHIEGPNRRVILDVGHDALRDGVLLGRYGRCDASEALDDPSLSRVHALLVCENDKLLLVDTASYNGTRVVGEHRARVIDLDRDIDLQVGKHTRMRWHWLG